MSISMRLVGLKVPCECAVTTGLQIRRTDRSLRLAAQDVALSRRKQGFESPRERHLFK